MSLGAPEFLTQLQALLPQGKAWSRSTDSDITKVLNGLAPELARVQGRAEDFLLEANPGTAVEMLPEYENVNGLPDPCAPTLGTTEERQNAVLARLREDAGHNPADYVALAETFGHTGTVVYRRPFMPFYAGRGRCGSRCYGKEWVHAFIVAYMLNRVTPSVFGGWTLSGTTVDANIERGPDGLLVTADRLNFGTSPSASVTNVFGGTPPAEALFSVWLRAESGTRSIRLTVSSVSNVDVTADFTVGSTWRRCALRTAHATGIDTVAISPTVTGTAQNVLAWGACVGEADVRFECRMRNVRQAHTVPDFRVIGDWPKD